MEITKKKKKKEKKKKEKKKEKKFLSYSCDLEYWSQLFKLVSKHSVQWRLFSHQVTKKLVLKCLNAVQR